MPPKPSDAKQKTLFGFFNKEKGKPTTASPPEASHNVAAQSNKETPLTKETPPTTHYHSASSPIEIDSEDEVPVVMRKRKSLLASSDDDDETDQDALSRSRIFKRPRSSSEVSAPESVTSEMQAPSDSSDILTSPEAHRTSSIKSLDKVKPSTHRRNSSYSSVFDAKPKKTQAKSSDSESPFSFLLDVRDRDGLRPTEPGYDPASLYIPKSAWSSFTPFEQQFWEIKQHHYDVVLFFQKGKFFELYEDDAKIGHREFDLKMTHRVKMSMVGVPESSFDFWAAKFLARGFKVGRVDQEETALGAEMRIAASKSSARGQNSGKKIVRRALNKVLTIGTLVDGNLLSDDHANHCMAIVESQSATETVFGVAILDAAVSEISLGFWKDDICRSTLETAIRQLRIKEIVFAKGKLCGPTVQVLKNSLSGDCIWNPVHDAPEYTLTEIKEEMRRTLSEGPEEPTDSWLKPDISECLEHQVTVSALGNLIGYLRQLNIEKEILSMANIKCYAPFRNKKNLSLDGQTLAHIEVLVNSEGSDDGTLHKLLNRCMTPYGKRLFRIWLCNPLADANDINRRLDIVEDLMASSAFEDVFETIVKGLPDLERLVARIHAKRCKVKDFSKVLSAFHEIQNRWKALLQQSAELTRPHIKHMLQTSPDLSVALQEVEEQFTQQGDQLLPCPGKYGAYDAAQKEIRGTESRLDRKLDELKKRLGSSLSYWHSSQGTKEIYLVQAPPGTKNLPKNWTKASSTKSVVRYTVPELAADIKQLKESRERRRTALEEFQAALYGEFDKHRSTWLGVIRAMAEVDCLLSLSKASASLEQPSCRPQIATATSAVIDFKDLRHPALLLKGDFIPNDVQLGAKERDRVVLLTGPNMGGKSTVMRMAAIGVIMAQLGMFVPASEAKISPIDSIFTRMGAYDNMFASASTFKVELDECCKILRLATPRSLVILDELGRGTSTFDGMAVAMAVLYFLASQSRSLTLFATHYSSLTTDFSHHPNITNMHMSSVLDDEKRELVFLYKLVNGAAPSSFGTHVASLAGVSPQVVQRAQVISDDFAAKFLAIQSSRMARILPLVSQADFAFLRQCVSGIREDSMCRSERIQIARASLRNYISK